MGTMRRYCSFHVDSFKVKGGAFLGDVNVFLLNEYAHFFCIPSPKYYLGEEEEEGVGRKLHTVDSGMLASLGPFENQCQQRPPAEREGESHTIQSQHTTHRPN